MTNRLPDAYYASKRSKVAASRKAAPIWDLLPSEAEPGMISMLAGKPNPATFPFRYIHLGVRPPGTSPLDNNTPRTDNLVIEGEDLDAALQYSTTDGMKELKNWLTTLVKTVHGRSEDEGWRVSLGPGSQDLLYKCLNAFLDPGDTLITEGPTYTGMIPIAEALGCQYATVEVDEDGIIASQFEKILENWDHSGPKPFPKLLYTIPYGGNPSGITASHARRAEVLRIARKYDILILEDDPYYFLYYGDAPRPPSYFTLEKQIGGEVGRVIRLDSFSKVLAAGFRLGWVTGPNVLITAIERHNTVSVVQASSLSQIVVLQLLKEWKLEGFLVHAKATADFYKYRRDAFVTILNRHLADLAEWTVPQASMFFWINLKLPPSLECKNMEYDSEGDSAMFIRSKMMKKGVLALPGFTSYVDGRRSTRVRVSFSLLSDDQMEEGIRRLAVALREEWGVTKKSA
ncbi:TdiD protein [Coprinopsis sp. MPI-PUGE-AT-0042]|nr:TdiD protein [Coprinopsis sp. MPI-PUGE-AT-0042]